MNCLNNVIKKRRSIYNLSNKIPITNLKLENIIKQALKNTPSAFNSQSSRLVLLYNQKHILFWNDIVLNTLRNNIPQSKLINSVKRIESFTNAYGTILYFEDYNTIKKLESKYPEYTSYINIWANQSNAMLQYIIWTMFAENNIGANLQHYNPIIDEKLAQTFNINTSWTLIAQMPFGGILKKADKKTNAETKERFKILK